MHELQQLRGKHTCWQGITNATPSLNISSDEHSVYPSSFKLLLCWLHSLTPVTSLSMLPGILSLAIAMHLEIYWV
ncbi:hypothetical protein [Photorhabdus australis]|uniref:hypothetical protein n=1 Tax=Photorhabdus australis TaxID=286156 RepID=UPI0030DB4395